MSSLPFYFSNYFSFLTILLTAVSTVIGLSELSNFDYFIILLLTFLYLLSKLIFFNNYTIYLYASVSLTFGCKSILRPAVFNLVLISSNNFGLILFFLINSSLL